MSITQIRRTDTLVPVTRPLRGTLLDAVPLAGGIARSEVTDLHESWNQITTGTLATFPCPASTLSAPVQSAASTATTGGTLAAGTYRAKVTAINTRGETIASNEISRATTGTTSTITWNWAASTGATGYNLYVSAVGGAANSETLLITLGAVTTYVWTGTPAQAPAAAAPPTVNTAVTPVSKTFDQSPAWGDGFKFATYIGVVCKAPGFDSDSAQAELSRVFANMESVSVARALLTNRFVAGGDWSAAPDITPAAGAVDPSVALALLEGYASSRYAGYPLIHASRTIGSLLTRNGQASLEGNVLTSALGTPIAADGGYESPNTSPTGAAPAAGEQWMYASGEVQLMAGDIINQAVLDYSESGDSNRVKILYERPYVAYVDGFTAAIKVKVQ